MSEIKNELDMVQKKTLAVSREKMNMPEMLELSTMLSKSTIVPSTYQHRPENCFIAVDMASRMGISPLVVMQNLHVIQGKPSWSGQAMASLVRTSSKFEDVILNYVGEPDTDHRGAYVTATLAGTSQTVKGAVVTIKVAKSEGWYQKSGSKWQTMPEIMLAYRAYAWFARVHSPEITMGLHSVEEVEDMTQKTVSIADPFADKEL